MAKASKKSKGTPRSGKRLSYKDIQIAYLSDGVAAVERLLKDGKASRGAVRKALDALRQQGAAAATLDDFVKTHIGQGRRGRSAPLVGTDRTYRAQKLATGSPFLRLPLEALGVKKGGLVTVRFERDRIIVTKV
ncbi:MAG: hypothetical protein Q8O67_00630 [Deltaproteobacteria bacterium]|nr:hypothetical protein [Deltaproteobacteria bacterium]